MSQTNSQLIAGLKELMLAGDEEKVKSYVFEHFKEFPVDFQQNVASALLSNGLDQAIKEKVTEFSKKTEAVNDTLKGLDTILEEEKQKAEQEEEGEAAPTMEETSDTPSEQV